VAPTAEVAVGDLVWFDSDGDGRQDDAEPSAPGVEVRLLDESATPVAVTTTDQFGLYRFVVVPGRYLIEVVLPDGMTITTPLVGTERGEDSDAATVDSVLGTSRTDWFDVPSSPPMDTVDVGLVAEPATPTTVTVAPTTEPTTTVVDVTTTAATTTVPSTTPPATPPPQTSTTPPTTAVPATSTPVTTTVDPPTTAVSG
jgi:hypothetical protein